MRYHILVCATLTLGCGASDDALFQQGAGGAAGEAGAAGSGGEVAGSGGSQAGAGGAAGDAGTSGSGGTDGGVDAGGTGGMGGADAGPTTCTPGQSQCDGSNLQTCGASGEWHTTAVCPYVCANNACSGVCSPGSMKCDGKTTQTCDSNGQWVDGSDCPFTCSQGACAGACSPGTTQCNGPTIQTCDNAGQWTDTNTCPYVCSGGSCAGSCLPGTSQCNGNSVQTCDASGQWQSGSACPFVCVAGACSGSCVPGEKKCSGTSTQTCNSLGQWAGTAACPSAPNSTPTCSGQGTCGTTCQQGFVDCNGNAGDGCETPLGTTSACLACGNACAAPAFAVPTCTASGCGFSCTSLRADCNGNSADGCEKDVSSDSKNCGGCGINCHGNACVSGQCQHTVEQFHSNHPDGINHMTGDANNLYWTYGTRLYKISKNTKVVQMLADTAPYSGGSVASNGTDVFWSSINTAVTPFARQIRKVSVNGGASTQMTASWAPNNLVTDGAYVYWNDQQPCPIAGHGCASPDNRVFRMPVGGGSPNLMSSFKSYVNGNTSYTHAESGSVFVPVYSHYEYDAGHKYYGRIYRVTQGSHSVAAWCGYYPGTAGCHDFEVIGNVTGNATHIFFMARTRQPVNATHSLYRVPKLGPPEAVWIGSYAPYFNNNTSLAADASHVYLAGEGVVGRFSVTPGPEPVEILSTGQNGANYLTLDATHAYWRVSGFNPPDQAGWADISIMRTVK